jgi:glycosyltransferase involved in cell wall biosynthesis
MRTVFDAERSGAPRVVTLGMLRDSLGLPFPDDLLGDAAEVMPASTDGPPFTALRSAGNLVRLARCEVVHVPDAAYAPAALMLRRRFGIPVSGVTGAGERRLHPQRLMGERLLRRFDQGFALHGRPLPAVLGRLHVVPLPPVARPLPEPSKAALRRMARLLGGVTPGRLVVALAWPADLEQLRWFRDAAMPLLHGDPVCLVLGAPGRRQARIMLGAIGLSARFRVHTGRIDADALSAAVRCADMFVTLGEPRPRLGLADMQLAVAASRLPLVAGGGAAIGIVEDESSGFVADGSDPFELVNTMNRLLQLPAVQRHYLGEDFAARMLERWPASAAGQVLGERFSVMAGRPQIPTDLRAA